MLTVNIRIGNDAVADHWRALETLRDALNDILGGCYPSRAPTITFNRHAIKREWLVRDANGNTVGEIQHVSHDNADAIAWNYDAEVAR